MIVFRPDNIRLMAQFKKQISYRLFRKLKKENMMRKGLAKRIKRRLQGVVSKKLARLISWA